MPDFQIVTAENGDVFYGFEADGTFIPVGNVSAVVIKQRQERAESLAELAKSDDPDAQKRHADAVNALPYSTKSTSGSKSKTSEKGGES